MAGAPAAERPTAIAVENIVKRYGDFEAVKGVNFKVAEGEIFGLLGPNGAGKSTLIKALGGRLRPDAGTIRVNGNPVTLAAPPDAHRLGIWTVFQELTLLPWLSVAENLLMAREIDLVGSFRFHEEFAVAVAALFSNCTP